MGLANVWVTFARSLIPFEMHGVVEALEVREEKHPGVDDVFILRLAAGSKGVVVDREIAKLFEGGEVIDKNAWSSEISIAGETIDIGTSTDFKRMSIAVPLLMLSVWIVLRCAPKK